MQKYRDLLNKLLKRNDDMTLEDFLMQELPASPATPDYANPIFGAARATLGAFRTSHFEDFIIKPSREVESGELKKLITHYYTARDFVVEDRELFGTVSPCLLDIKKESGDTFTVNISDDSIDGFIRVSLLPS